MSLQGTKETEKAIPDYLTAASEDVVDRAGQIAKIPYMANPHLRVAALSPQQEAAMNANIGAASSFGIIAPNSMTAGAGLPEAETVNGIKGYSSIGGFDAALEEARRRYPEAMARYDALYANNPEMPQFAQTAQPQAIAPPANWDTIVNNTLNRQPQVGWNNPMAGIDSRGDAPTSSNTVGWSNPFLPLDQR
jgi:hypothetical protein